jgi:hypothetical protein
VLSARSANSVCAEESRIFTLHRRKHPDEIYLKSAMRQHRHRPDKKCIHEEAPITVMGCCDDHMKPDAANARQHIRALPAYHNRVSLEQPNTVSSRKLLRGYPFWHANREYGSLLTVLAPCSASCRVKAREKEP